jgi:transposase-like protein
MANELTVKKMIKLWIKNHGSHSAVAKEFGCSREYVRQVLSPLGYGPSRVRKNGATDPNLVEKVKEMANSNKNRKEIIKDLKISASIYNRVLQMNPEIDRPKGLHKEYKYSTETLVALYEKHNGNYSGMARDLGVASSFVSRAMKDRGLKEKYPAKYHQKEEIAPTTTDNFTELVSTQMASDMVAKNVVDPLLC